MIVRGEDGKWVESPDYENATLKARSKLLPEPQTPPSAQSGKKRGASSANGGSKAKKPSQGGTSSGGAGAAAFPPLQSPEEGISVSVVRNGDKMLPVIPPAAFAELMGELDQQLGVLPPAAFPKLKREINRDTQRGWIVTSERDFDLIKDYVSGISKGEYVAKKKEEVIAERKIAKGITNDTFSGPRS